MMQKQIPLKLVEAHRIAMVEQLVAIQVACESLVKNGDFTEKGMSKFLQAFFYKNAKNLLNI